MDAMEEVPTVSAIEVPSGATIEVKCRAAVCV